MILTGRNERRKDNTKVIEIVPEGYECSTVVLSGQGGQFGSVVHVEGPVDPA